MMYEKTLILFPLALAACGDSIPIDDAGPPTIDAAPLDSPMQFSDAGPSDASWQPDTWTCSAVAPSKVLESVSECLVSLAGGQDFASAIAVDATNVYWATNTELLKISKAGGKPVVLAPTQMQAFAIAVSATNVYWSVEYAGAIMKVPVGGGTPTTFASATAPTGLAVDAVNVYWADYGANTISKKPIGGGATVTLASLTSPPQGLAVDAQNVYWVADDGSVAYVPIAGGSSTPLATEGGSGLMVAVDATTVYWTSGYAVWAVPIAGGTASLVGHALNWADGVAVDATRLYWTDMEQVYYTSKTNTSQGSLPLYQFEPAPYGLVSDGTSIYWTSQSMDASVMKTTLY